MLVQPMCASLLYCCMAGLLHCCTNELCVCTQAKQEPKLLQLVDDIFEACIEQVCDVLSIKVISSDLHKHADSQLA